MRQIPEPEQLRRMYEMEGLTITQIAARIGMSMSGTRTRLLSAGVSFRSAGFYLKGRPKSDEHRRKLSIARSGAKNPNFGKKCKHGKRCWYMCPDGSTVSMRSQWEAWFAKYLTDQKLTWSYEPKTFNLGDGRAYTPDFYIEETSEYVEVKGWFRPEHKDKLDQWRIEYPDLKLVIADKQYLEDLGIDLRKQWIATRPQFKCEHCGKDFHRQYPSQRLCSVKCRNTFLASGRRLSTEDHPKRIYRGVQKGEANNSSKLTAETVLWIRKLRHDGYTLHDIAARTGASLGNIFNIVKGRSWTHYPVEV